MKRVLQAWGWSLGVAAHSLVTLLGLALLAGLWGIAAYEWLDLPESSILILIIVLAWAIAQWVVAAAVMAGTASSAGEAAWAAGARSLPRLGFVTFRPRLIAKALLFSIAAALVVFALSNLFAWVNGHSVEVGSFLTFHAETPTSHIWVEKVFDIVEDLLWVAMAGLLIRVLIFVVHAGWKGAGRDFRPAFTDCFWKGSFLSGLAAVLFFGWIPYRLANWVPHASPGFWDYFQLLARMGVALLLVAYGWLFWLLAVARLSLPASPPAAHPGQPSPPQS
jgi:hypothetical protein